MTAVPILEGNHKKLLWFSNSHNLILKAHATGLKSENGCEYAESSRGLTCYVNFI